MVLRPYCPGRCTSLHYLMPHFLLFSNYPLESGVYWGFADKNCGHYTTTHFASVDNEQNFSARVFV